MCQGLWQTQKQSKKISSYVNKIKSCFHWPHATQNYQNTQPPKLKGESSFVLLLLALNFIKFELLPKVKCQTRRIGYNVKVQIRTLRHFWGWARESSFVWLKSLQNKLNFLFLFFTEFPGWFSVALEFLKFPRKEKSIHYLPGDVFGSRVNVTQCACRAWFGTIEIIMFN